MKKLSMLMMLVLPFSCALNQTSTLPELPEAPVSNREQLELREPPLKTSALHPLMNQLKLQTLVIGQALPVTYQFSLAAVPGADRVQPGQLSCEQGALQFPYQVSVTKGQPQGTLTIFLFAPYDWSKKTLACRFLPIIQLLTSMGDPAPVVSSAKANELDTIAIFTVQHRQFAQEQLSVAPGKAKPRTAKDQQRVDRDNRLLNKIHSASAAFSYLNAPFLSPPLDSVITSPYGLRRLFNGELNSVHYGVDFRAAVDSNGIGVEFRASGTGRVVLAEDLFFTGGTIIIDHGLGLFTLYAHLSQYAVKVGEVVQQGEILGKTGKTGRISGPHLHWGVRINAHKLDGLSLLVPIP